ncbi:MAG: DsbC family protein [Betaproteobacteria bacterium]|nr:DsbC family protein [Betaproteobacteria bacterium]
MKKFLPALAAAILWLATPAHAEEAAVKAAIEAKLAAKVDGVTRTPHLGLYEVRADGQIFYTDEKVSLIFAGDIIDARTMQNLTQERLRKLSSIKFSDLPLEQSFKIVRGNGKRVVAYFADPNCAYCKRFEKDLQSLPDLTIHTFMLPILSADSMEKSKAVWCSPDRAKAWMDMMLNGVNPTAAGTCDTPLEKNLALAEKYRIRGTPTLFLSSGERIPGAVPAAQLEKMLAQSKGK